MVDDRHPVGHPFGFVHVMGRQDDRDALLPEPPHEPPHVAPELDITPGHHHGCECERLWSIVQRDLGVDDAVRIANADYLTCELAKIPGVIPPYCPPGSKHVYFMYNIRFDPAAAGVDVEPRRFRIAVEKALYKEGVLVGQWQTMPVPAQDLFRPRLVGIMRRLPPRAPGFPA